jgi:hypothetical protein
MKERRKIKATKNQQKDSTIQEQSKRKKTKDAKQVKTPSGVLEHWIKNLVRNCNVDIGWSDFWSEAESPPETKVSSNLLALLLS